MPHFNTATSTSMTKQCQSVTAHSLAALSVSAHGVTAHNATAHNATAHSVTAHSVTAKSAGACSTRVERAASMAPGTGGHTAGDDAPDHTQPPSAP